MTSRVQSLLNHFENQTMTSVQATAYNYLIEYEEGLFLPSLEGDRLLGLCIEILEEAKK